MNIIRNQLPPVTSSKDYVAVDSEWHDLKDATIHRPTSGDFSSLQLCENGEDVYFITDKEKAVQALANVQQSIWAIHEAKFDLVQLGRFVPRQIIHHPHTIDTLMIEKILWSGYYNRFGLAHLTRRYLGVKLDKELQKSFRGSEMSEEQVQYACRDALYLRKVWDEQKTHITNDDMYVYKKIDLPCMFAVMDFQGFCINVDGWRKLAQENRAKQEELDKSIPVNPRSPNQVKEFLRKNGFPKLENSQEETLQKMIAKYPDTVAAKVSQNILDSRMYGKRASTYGESWIDNFIEPEPDGSYSITCNYNIIGTETGRFSADAPNMQNIPTRETKAYRKQFIPRKGHVLIVGDYSQQEVGIEAYASDDKKLISLYNQGGDIYVLTAKEMFGKSITKKDPLRALMKSLVLGLDYGLSKYGLARKTGISVDEAEEHIKKFLKTFPGINNYQIRQRKQTTSVKTILGRRIWLNSYSSQRENNALNAPIQGSAADMLKLAIVTMHKEWPFPFPFSLVAAVHDELVMDVPVDWAKQSQEFMKNTMESIARWMCDNKVLFRADVHICEHDWSEKELE